MPRSVGVSKRSKRGHGKYQRRLVITNSQSFHGGRGHERKRLPSEAELRPSRSQLTLLQASLLQLVGLSRQELKNRDISKICQTYRHCCTEVRDLPQQHIYFRTRRCLPTLVTSAASQGRTPLRVSPSWGRRRPLTVPRCTWQPSPAQQALCAQLVAPKAG